MNRKLGFDSRYVHTEKENFDREPRKQRGAEEACRAHNPEVGGSKPLVASGETTSKQITEGV